MTYKYHGTMMLQCYLLTTAAVHATFPLNRNVLSELVDRNDRLRGKYCAVEGQLLHNTSACGSFNEYRCYEAQHSQTASVQLNILSSAYREARLAFLVGLGLLSFVSKDEPCYTS
eukprot:4892663-Pyramimonas_sp.AAC.1